MIISAVLLFAAGGAAEVMHVAPAMARVTMSDGSLQTVAFRGLGCSASVCSRKQFRSETDSSWLDSVAEIMDTSEAVANQPRSGMDALVVFKDGTKRRQAIVADFRYLYFANSAGVPGKLDLAKVKTLEFLGSAK